MDGAKLRHLARMVKLPVMANFHGAPKTSEMSRVAVLSISLFLWWMRGGPPPPTHPEMPSEGISEKSTLTLVTAPHVEGQCAV